jgi:UDP-GlcNAc:undecaprenyl-phosphate/decaprenyl-phosphate GlcNAc-1-phosphate transferase
MEPYVLIFLVSLLTATLLTPLARAFALRLGAVSSPGERHVHARSIPRLGGVALALGWGGPLAALLAVYAPAEKALEGHQLHLFALFGGGAALCAVGAVDDLRGLRALHKLLAQTIIACFAFALGFRIDAIALPFLGTLQMGVFALPVTLLWIVGITNAVNLIDGLDGLAAGVAFFAAFTSFLVAYLSGSPFVALLMAGLMGALIGFLFFNFNPARIFMGDSGSYLLGYLLSTTALTGAVQQKASTAVSLLVPVIALGLPIFDTLFSMVRRILERRPIFSPDRGHVHHRLLELGLTHRRAVILLYGVSIVLAAGAVAVSLGQSWQVGVALLFVSVVFVALVRFLGYFEYLHARRRHSSRFYDPHANRLRLTLRSLLPALAEARSEQSVFETLERVRRECQLSSVAVALEGQPLCTWQSNDRASATRHLVASSFPLGRDEAAKGTISFCWLSDHEEADAQATILLQLFVDALIEALSRVDSPLVRVQADVQSGSLPRESVPALS